MTSALKRNGPIEIDLHGAYILRTSFRGASLVGASLYLANCREADFSMTLLRSANLRKADFTNADLSGADFEGANLDGTILIGADLTNAKNLTLWQIKSAIFDASTKLPPNLRTAVAVG